MTYLDRIPIFGRIAVATATFGLAFAVVSPAQGQVDEIQDGGTMVVALTGDPPLLNTIHGADLLAVTVSGQIHETLIILDQQLQVHPALARSWEISPDGLTYTFHLRDDVQWHDGEPFTSADVKYSFGELLPEYNSLANNAYSQISEIETPDDHTVIIRLATVDPAFFPWAFSQTNFAQIFPEHVFRGTDIRQGPANYSPIGTGPFVFREWSRGSHIVLERNENYYAPVHLDRVVFQIIPETGARQLALERGDVDYLPYFALAASAIETLGANPDTRVIPAMRPPQGIIMAHINLREAPLSDVRVRRALAHAVNNEQIVDLALDGMAIPGTGPIRSDNPVFYNPDITRYDRDLARANALLDEAGYPRGSDGTRFGLRITYQATGEGGALQSAAEIMREQLREVGIALQLIPTDSATWQELSYMQWDFDLTLGSFGTGPDPAIGIARFYTTENIVPRTAANMSAYSNPVVDDLFARAAIETDPAERTRLYQEVQAILVDDVPTLWLWEKFYPIAVRANLLGMPGGAMHSEPWNAVGWAAQ